MTEEFLHGIRVVSGRSGVRPVNVSTNNVIGMVGTAPNVDADKFPINTPVLVDTPAMAEALAKGERQGSLPRAMEDILKQARVPTVVVRVEEGSTPEETLQNVNGDIMNRTGLWALLNAPSVTGFRPGIICAPGFTYPSNAVSIDLASLSTKTKAVAVFDAKAATFADAQEYRQTINNMRAYIVNGQNVDRPLSPGVAALIAKTPPWESPSNKTIEGIQRIVPPADFTFGDHSCFANQLNSIQVSTVIRLDGHRLWGNRTAYDDPAWQFLSVVRTSDLIDEALNKSFLWAVDRNLTKTFFDEVAESVTAFLATLRAKGAIAGGECWPDETLNTAGNLKNGQGHFKFDVGFYAPGETLTFTRQINDEYLTKILA